jgi:hypothetical protein
VFAAGEVRGKGEEEVAGDEVEVVLRGAPTAVFGELLGPVPPPAGVERRG